MIIELRKVQFYKWNIEMNRQWLEWVMDNMTRHSDQQIRLKLKVYAEKVMNEIQEYQDIIDHVSSILSKLPEEERQLLHQVYIEGHSLKDILEKNSSVAMVQTFQDLERAKELFERMCADEQ